MDPQCKEREEEAEGRLLFFPTNNPKLPLPLLRLLADGVVLPLRTAAARERKERRGRDECAARAGQLRAVVEVRQQVDFDGRLVVRQEDAGDVAAADFILRVSQLCSLIFTGRRFAPNQRRIGCIDLAMGASRYALRAKALRASFGEGLMVIRQKRSLLQCGL